MNNLLAIPAYLETGMLKIATIDIAVFAILAIALIVGYVKGFMKQILSLLGFLASAILAFIFADDLAEFIFNKVPFITDKVRDLFSSMLGSVLGENLASEESVLLALQNSKIPAFLHGIIASLIANSDFNLQIVDVLTKWGLTVISFILIVIVLNIVFLLLKKFFKFITQIPLIKAVDKTLGMIFSALKALLILVIICSILSLFTDINAYLIPEDGVISVFNKFMEFIMNLPFIKNILKK